MSLISPRRQGLNLLGLVLGLLVGWQATAIAQTVIAKFKIDVNNAVCWDQPHESLAAANAMKVRVTYDPAPGKVPTDAAFACVGSASPFTCTLASKVPLSVQTVGVHRVLVEGANLDPLDQTYTPYAVLDDFSVEFVQGAVPPARGGNGRIVRVLAAIAAAIMGLWTWLT